jgi:uncharacterized protein (DUF736 family)
MKIGNFIKTDVGSFRGDLQTITFTKEIEFVPVDDKSAEKAPDYVIVKAGTNIEIGAGWNKTAKSGNPFIKVKIDDPILPFTLWAALTSDEQGEYILYWSRPNGKSGGSTSDQDTL